MTEAEHESDSMLTKDTPYFILMGELWNVNCEHFVANWLHYNNIVLQRTYFTIPWRDNKLQGPLLLTWFNFNPSMDK